MKNIRYIIFERPKGSLCWTIAYDSNGSAIQCSQYKTAKGLAAQVKTRKGNNGQPMQAHIAKVELPWTKADQKTFDDWKKGREFDECQ